MGATLLIGRGQHCRILPDLTQARATLVQQTTTKRSTSIPIVHTMHCIVLLFVLEYIVDHPKHQLYKKNYDSTSISHFPVIWDLVEWLQLWERFFIAVDVPSDSFHTHSFFLLQ